LELKLERVQYFTSRRSQTDGLDHVERTKTMRMHSFTSRQILQDGSLKD